MALITNQNGQPVEDSHEFLAALTTLRSDEIIVSLNKGDAYHYHIKDGLKTEMIRGFVQDRKNLIVWEAVRQMHHKKWSDWKVLIKMDYLHPSYTIFFDSVGFFLSQLKITSAKIE